MNLNLIKCYLLLDIFSKSNVAHTVTHIWVEKVNLTQLPHVTFCKLFLYASRSFCSLDQSNNMQSSDKKCIQAIYITYVQGV